MCGRLNIIDDPLTKVVSELLGIDFLTQSNSNLCPSEEISTIGLLDNHVTQINANWGIKPDWAKKLLINAQVETVASKKTFKKAFSEFRCIVPFSGWYEWKSTDTGKKQKFLFDQESKPLYMGAILYKNPAQAYKPDLLAGLTDAVRPQDIDYSLVTITTKASAQCSEIHHRMPLLIPAESINQWLFGDLNDGSSLMTNRNELFRISPAN